MPGYPNAMNQQIQPYSNQLGQKPMPGHPYPGPGQPPMPGYPNAGYGGQAPYPGAAGFAGQLDQFGRPVQYDQYGRPILGPPVPVPLDLGAEEGAADDPDFVPAPTFQPPFIVSVVMVLTGFSGLLDWIADQR